ncbi:hypothetical protein SPRG_10899 [Saprolegnia parasitica CBS 223.65]|uniref:Uncharacterized protein n=1 Tax=Saprolegnia parasitica (strain CBS 223.65) TaxID=695850 RepID=A0A067CC48_SAPPC|nr:hypothetical protein SPRG_10899 [Saprolegnia parasitica CBS 223.65]KDO24111.1 hypothetical protein SPRG_10899 [Saprolegnia parasitica CBS 223.65]|eukprot:XP_012205246.1 hypothetical protein SPRG_10899 [Saprolegnia parasitica CBS 223.65]
MTTIGSTPFQSIESTGADVATELLADERGPLTYLFDWFIKALRDADSACAKQGIFGLGLLLPLPALLPALCISFKVDGKITWQWRTIFALVWLVDAACLVYCIRAIPSWPSATKATLSRTIAHLAIYIGITMHHAFIALQLDGQITLLLKWITWGWIWVFFPFVVTTLPEHATLLTIVAWAQMVLLAPRLDGAVLWSWPVVILPLELYAMGSLVSRVYYTLCSTERPPRAVAVASLIACTLLLVAPLGLLLARLEGCEFPTSRILVPWFLLYGFLMLWGFVVALHKDADNLYRVVFAARGMHAA